MKSLELSIAARRLRALLRQVLLLAAWGTSVFAAEPSTSKSDRSFARLTPAAQRDRFDFETPEMRGTIRLEGPYHGVSRLVDKRTGRQVIDERYAALNLFKLMSVNQMMDEPRTMAREIRADPQFVEAAWAPTATHKGEVLARYEVAAPNAVDLTLTVRSGGVYAGYEVFLSSYFDKRFVPHVYLAPGRSLDAVDPVVPMVSDIIRGTLPVFARDALAARRSVDGRWERNERGASVVQMCPVRHYRYCLAAMVDPDDDLAVILMAHPKDCYAISTRYHAASQSDRLTPYSAFDLSLFGDDFIPGDARTVKVRLALARLKDDRSRALELYHAFVAQREAAFRSPDPDERHSDGSR